MEQQEIILVLNQEEPLILGIVAFLSIMIMVFNLIVDIS